MTTLEHAASIHAKPAPRTLWTRLANSIRFHARAWKNRREIYRLGAMSDFDLADIGLTRADLHLAARSPFGTDPTARLGVIASGRARAHELAACRVRRP